MGWSLPDGEDEFSPTGEKTKVDTNIAALEILQRCEQDKRSPTAEEARQLAAYSGWGFCKTLFDDLHWSVLLGRTKANLVVNHTGWAREWETRARRAHELLGDEAWSTARRSILDAHYTGARIGRALWQTVREAGFKGGRVLEPAVGTGQLLSVMPRELRALCEIDAVEMDVTSARIARALHPDVRVTTANFVAASRELEGGYDLIIANVPFGKACPEELEGEPKFSTHNYFIRRCADLLRPGGIMVTLTSSATLQNNPEQRAVLAQHLELHGVIRFSNRTFKAVAGTEVIEDLLVLRKPVVKDLLEPGGLRWAHTKPVDVGSDYSGMGGTRVAQVNEALADSPQFVLGHHSLRGKLYGSPRVQYTVAAFGTEQEEERALANALGSMFERYIYIPRNRVARLAEHARREQLEHQQAVTIRALGRLEKGQFVEVGGPQSGFQWTVGVWNGRSIAPPPWRDGEGKIRADYKFPRGMDVVRAEAVITAVARLVRVYRAQLALDIDEGKRTEETDAHRAELREAYERTVKVAKSRLNESASLRRLAGDDPFWPLLTTLEKRVSEMREGKEVFRTELAAVMKQRAYEPRRAPETVATLEEGVMASQGWRGGIDVGYIAQLLELDEAECERQLVSAEFVFRDPEDGCRLVPREHYLSGAVGKRLEAAKAAQEAGERGDFTRNIAALEAVQRSAPSLRERFDAQPDGDGPVTLGATWVDPSIIGAYLQEALGQKEGWVPIYNSSAGRWSLPQIEFNEKLAAFTTSRRTVSEVVRIALNKESTRVVVTVRGHAVFSPEHSEALAQVVAKLKIGWREWLCRPGNPAFAEVERGLSKLGDYRPVRYDGSRLVLRGLAGHFKPRAVQRDAIARNLAEQRGVNALGVGFGKTATFAVSAIESVQRGLARRVMIVCDNSNYDQFAAELRALYPHMGIFAFDNAHLHHARLAETAAQIAAGDVPIVMMSRTQFLRLRVRPEVEMEFVEELLEQTRDAIADLRASSQRGGGQREAERTLQAKEKKLDARMQSLRGQGASAAVYFDDMGIDLLLLDECHKYYRRAPIPYHGERIKGLPTGESDMAVNALLKARIVQSRRGGGRGVIGATGTPMNNTLAEVWAMARMFAPDRLEQFGVQHFKDFLDLFTEERSELEVDEATMRWRKVTRLSSFKNAPELSRFVSSFMESRFDHSEAQINVPKIKGGGYEFEVVPLSDPVERLQDMFCQVRDKWEKRPNKRKQMEVPIVLIGLGLASAIDPRLVVRDAPDEPESLVNLMVRKAVTVYAEHQRAGKPSTQVIFCDRFRPVRSKLLGALTMAALDREAEDTEPAPAEDEEFEAEDEEISETDGADGDEMEKALEAGRKAEELQSTQAAWEFHLHHDIADKLVAEASRQGVELPRSCICVSSDLSNEQLKAMCDRANSGTMPFIIGTARIGTGLNYQRYQIAQHHIGPPMQMVPSELTQRVGRGVRQGNENPEIGIYLWGMEDTASVGVWGRIRYKERMILQFLKGEELGVTWEDPCGQVSFSDLQAAMVRDQRQLRRAELQHSINREKMRLKGVRIRLGDARNRADWLKSDQAARLRLAAHLDRHAGTMAKWAPINKEGVVLEAKIDQPLIRGTSGRFEGTLKDARAWLESRVSTWSSMAHESTTAPFGRLVVNGMELHLSKWKFLGRDDNVIRATEPIVDSYGNFTTADGVFMAQKRARLEADGAADRARKRAAELGVELKAAEAELPGLETSASEAPLNELVHELSELENDMFKNPHAGRSERREARLAAIRARRGEVVDVEAEVSTANDDDEEEPMRLFVDAATPVVLAIRRRSAGEIFFIEENAIGLASARRNASTMSV